MSLKIFWCCFHSPHLIWQQKSMLTHCFLMSQKETFQRDETHLKTTDPQTKHKKCILLDLSCCWCLLGSPPGLSDCCLFSLSVGFSSIPERFLLPQRFSCFIWETFSWSYFLILSINRMNKISCYFCYPLIQVEQNTLFF